MRPPRYVLVVAGRRVETPFYPHHDVIQEAYLFYDRLPGVLIKAYYLDTGGKLDEDELELEVVRHCFASSPTPVGSAPAS